MLLRITLYSTHFLMNYFLYACAMERNFEDLCKNKRKINDDGKPKLYKEREIWWCALGVNIGSEQDGTSKGFRRPVLIVKGFGFQTCLIVPLTTSKNTHPLRITLGIVNGRNATAMLSQLRTIDTKRLIEKIGFANRISFRKIQKILRNFF
jgi:mRNA interferase MazF